LLRSISVTEMSSCSVSRWAQAEAGEAAADDHDVPPSARRDHAGADAGGDAGADPGPTHELEQVISDTHGICIAVSAGLTAPMLGRKLKS
jgi:hypothetical protein